jgi:hypothetical protein
MHSFSVFAVATLLSASAMLSPGTAHASGNYVAGEVLVKLELASDLAGIA